MSQRSDPFLDVAWSEITVDEPPPPAANGERAALRWIPEPRTLRRVPESCSPPSWRVIPDDLEGALSADADPAEPPPRRSH